MGTMSMSNESAAPRIAVVGVGGIGLNALTNLMLRKLSGVSYIAIDSDFQQLHKFETTQKIWIDFGNEETPNIDSVLEKLKQLPAFLKYAEIVFIIAGMGGATGTSVAPKIAQIVKKSGVITVGFAVSPFLFEKQTSQKSTKYRIAEFIMSVDYLVKLSDKEILQKNSNNTSATEMLKRSDHVLCDTIKCISALMHTPNYTTLDIDTVRSFVRATSAISQQTFRSIVRTNSAINQQTLRSIVQSNSAISQQTQPMYLENIDKDLAELDFLLDEMFAASNPPVALPSLDLIESVATNSPETPYAVLQEKANLLMTCLSNFGIQGELVGITSGPVVTMFEVRLAKRMHLFSFTLPAKLAADLKVNTVRIQAPVPGTDTVGIEIPNETREMVCLRELLASQQFTQSQSLLTLALGKDIAGNPAVANLASMPHLLVAGANRTEKNVGINSVILSLLYKARPDDVRFLLIAPKKVNMAIYHDLPHLVHPVVTDMVMAKNALGWAVEEMEQRYSDMAKTGVLNIAKYNEKLKELGRDRTSEMDGIEAMPYLVVIIDDFADLMLEVSKEVERNIVRLTQFASSAGIHLILATQRPSVAAVTRIIEANVPWRIVFQLTSRYDSQAILDTAGAENLLGKGDMLLKPGGRRLRLKRMHGAFVSDSTVKAVVDYWKRMVAPSYCENFSDWRAAESGEDGEFGWR